MQDVYRQAVQLSQSDAGLSELNAMIDYLINAISALEKVERASLGAVMKDAEALHKHDYTKETWDQLEIALSNAKIVYGKTSVNQNEIEDAKHILEASIKGLKKVLVIPIDPVNPDDGNGETDTGGKDQGTSKPLDPNSEDNVNTGVQVNTTGYLMVLIASLAICVIFYKKKKHSVT